MILTLTDVSHTQLKMMWQQSTQMGDGFMDAGCPQVVTLGIVLNSNIVLDALIIQGEKLQSTATIYVIF